MPDDTAIEVVRLALKTQNLGVLATFGEKYPYTSLVGFVRGSSEREIIFTTLKNTRKYSYLTRRPEVSILINTGINSHSDFEDAAAITALGSAAEVHSQEKAGLKALYLNKFPFLKDFISDPNCAFIKVSVKKYVVVTRFQKVSEIVFD